VPWRTQVKPIEDKSGYLLTDGTVQPRPPQSRKILLVIAAFAFSRALSEPSGGIFGIFPTPHFVEGMSSVRVIQALYLRDVLGHTTYVLGLFVLALSVALILYMIGARKVAAFRARWRTPQGDIKVDIEAANDVVEK